MGNAHSELESYVVIERRKIILYKCVRLLSGKSWPKKSPIVESVPFASKYFI